MIENKIDVRTIAPRERHPTLFRAFDELGVGESFEFVNDHDPKPLLALFASNRPQEFSWQYLEQGPQLWQVRIGRVGGPRPAEREEGCCGICGSE